MINLRQFETNAEYEAYVESEELVVPNVSQILEDHKVKYLRTIPPTPTGYTNQYFTFEVLTPGNIYWCSVAMQLDNSNDTIQYSKNGGEWTDITGSMTGTPISVVEGDVVRFKNTTDKGYMAQSEDGMYVNVFGSDYNPEGETGCTFNVYGNIMSLICGDNFEDETTMPADVMFGYLFASDVLSMLGGPTIYCGLVSAENLILPSTTLTYGCYSAMFAKCPILTTAPTLPATTLADGCYYNMFAECRRLTSAPALPATTLVNQCYTGMFEGCISLITAPELPATNLADNCYQGMFYGCTGLSTALALPATTLADSCYYRMFYGCTSLTMAPALPATTLVNQCYYGMFNDCTNLTTAPALPATTLAESCYESMFQGCTSLNYIKCLATDISAYSCTSNWVNGVASTGTFVKDSGMSSWTTGTSGIPTNWTVQDYSPVN